MRLLPALAVLTLAALAGCSGTRPAPLADDGTPIVARWSADTLSLAEFDAAYVATDGAIVDTTQTPIERRLDFLDRYVDFRLKVLDARRSGYADDSSYAAEVEAYRDQLAGPYFTDKQVMDDIVRDMYDKQAEEIEVSHVLFLLSPTTQDTVEVFARAQALKDSLQADLIAFEDAARQYSADPSAQQNGGNIGYITGGRTILPFENETYATPVGEIGGPVRTRFGVHLLKVTDRRPAVGQIEARHILVGPAADGSLDSARTVIEDLRARVLAGEDFAALAEEYSIDTGSAQRGGALGAFGRGRMVPPFEAAAFALENEGDLSEPVETRFGVHLIQLTSRPERPSFDESYPTLRRQAERLPRTALRRQAIGREYFDANGGTYDEALVREAIGQYPADEVAQRLPAEGFGDYADRPFATLGDSTYTLGRLVQPLRAVRYGPHPADEMAQTARQWVDEQAVDAAIRSLEDRDPEFARVFRSYADGVLLFRVAEDSVWTPAKDDSLGLRRYYDARPGAFRYPERRRVLAFRSLSDSLLTRVADALAAGTPPADARRGILTGVQLDTLHVADSTGTDLDAVLALGVGEATGILEERRGRVIYVLDGIEAPRAKTFAEARAELVTGYQEELEEAWEARLRARYDAQTFPERVPARAAPTPPMPAAGAAVSR